jgi:hypothetical protein
MLGAGGPPGPNLEPRHTVAGDFARLVLDDAHAFTVRGASASSRIDAYGLDDGEHLWSTAVRGMVIRMLADAGVLLVSADDTVALDAVTGKVRWRQSAASLLGRSGDVAVVSTLPGVIGGYSIRTGEPRWVARTSPDTRTVIEYEPGRPTIVDLADWNPDSTVQLRDPGDGAVRGHFTTGRRAATDADVYLVDGALLIAETESAGIRWYNGKTGMPANLPKVGYTVTTGVTRCGANACVGNNGGLTAIDLVGGRMVWHVNRWNVFRPLTSGVAIVYDATAVQEGFTGALIDPASGRILDRLSGWQPTDASRAPEVVLWHRMPAGGALFAVHNAQTGQRTTVGRVSGWETTPTCELDAAHLVCYGGDELAIWRLPATL